MPEGDSAYRVAHQLSEALGGSTLTEFQVRTANLASENLQGQTVSGVVPYGKHLLIRIGDWSLHSHMLMDGTWHLYKPGSRWRRPAHQARIILATKQIQAVGFLVAQIKLVKTADELSLVGHLGPDPLKDEWNSGGRERAAQNLSREIRPIHVALLDQSNVAGFGNEYANELCFLTGADPRTPACQVDALGFMKLGERLIKANRDRVERTTTGNTRPGQRLYVYGRAGKPCRRCGTVIQFMRLGADPSRARHVYWCSHCQPAV